MILAGCPGLEHRETWGTPLLMVPTKKTNLVHTGRGNLAHPPTWVTLVLIMRIAARFAVCVLIVVGLGLSSQAAFGCSCVAPPPGIKSARELAEWRTQGVSAIFEGMVEAAEMKSPLLEASAGDVVPADLEQSTPVMLVSFSVSRSYRGVQQQHVQIETGLGGGDCGFPFETGRQYLVYAYKNDSGRLSTRICTATALLEDSQANLAYLRDEPMVPHNSQSSSHIGSKLCARILKDQAIDSRDDADDKVWLFRVGSTSPIPSEELEPDEKGDFCAANIDPGTYHLVFAEVVVDSPISFLYYPGVVNVSQATSIVIRSDQTSPDIVFKIPFQPTFSVSGVISTPNNSHLPANIKVMLISADQPFLALAYAQDVALAGTFSFPRVLPGRYWSFVDVDSDSGDSGRSKWLTRKTELLIDGNLAHLSLTLIPN